MSPKDSQLGQQLSPYVCARITRMEDVDIGLLDYDRNNAVYFFAMNADEQIYMRYGGRDSQSADTYLNLSSLELPMKQGLELHRRYQKAELNKEARPKPQFPRQNPLLVKRTLAQIHCLEARCYSDSP